MEPDNLELQLRLQEVEELRHQGVCTLPSSIGIEKRTNPFLRCHLPQLRHAAESHSGKICPTSAQVFGTLRQLKDDWR
jgi:hydroxyacylglutathione hydrolase